MGPLIIETPVEHYAHLDICQTPVHIPIDRELKSVQYSVVDVKSLQPRATTESGNQIMLFILVMLKHLAVWKGLACEITHIVGMVDSSTHILCQNLCCSG